jgi:hypothetical protein
VSEPDLLHALELVQGGIEFLKSTAEVGLRFPKLHSTPRLVCYSDASFGGNIDHSSQIAGIVMLVDQEQNAHVLTWFSRKSARVTVSVLTAETLSMVSTVDIAYALRLQLQAMGLAFELDVLTDSKQLYQTLEGHGSVREKRLMLDVAALRQMFRKKEITRLGFVRSEYNLADRLTKLKTLDASSNLTQLLSTGKLPFIVEKFLV